MRRIPDMHKTIKVLAEREMLPAIWFILSRWERAWAACVCACLHACKAAVGPGVGPEAGGGRARRHTGQERWGAGAPVPT